MKTLVTGANGFLGRSVVRALLREGIEVRALLRPGRSLDASGAEICEGDICDDAAVESAVRGVDCVVHAAARVATSGTWEEFADVNVRGTRRILDAARRAGVQRVIHISSLSVYAVDDNATRIIEESPYESETAARGGYSRSKLAADRVAMHAAERGLPVVVLRPGLLYGPGRRPPLARQNFKLARFKLILANPQYLLPLSYVDNVADAVLLAAQCDAAVRGAFTIVDGNIHQADYVARYRAAAEENWHPVFLPVGMMALSALALERSLRLIRRRSPVTYHQIRRATLSAEYDCSRAQRLLGWQPRVGIDEGLQRTFASLRSAPSLAGAPAMAV